VALDIDGPAFNAWFLLKVAQIDDANINAGKLEK